MGWSFFHSIKSIFDQSRVETYKESDCSFTRQITIVLFLKTLIGIEPKQYSMIVCHSWSQYPKSALALVAVGSQTIVDGSSCSGKSLLSDTFQTILNNDKKEVFRTYLMEKQVWSISSRPPFISPHHFTSEGKLIGEQRYLRSGKMSIAHFPRRVNEYFVATTLSGSTVVNRVEESN